MTAKKIELKICATGFVLGIFFLTHLSGCSKGPAAPSPVTDTNRQARLCASALKMFADGKKLWAEQNNKTAEDIPTMQDIVPFIACSTNCPGGGTYTLGKVSELPTCSIPEHQAAFLKKMEAQSGQGQPAQ